MQRELSLSLTVWDQPGENCRRSTSQCSHHKSPSPSPRGPPRPRPVSQAPLLPKLQSGDSAEKPVGLIKCWKDTPETNPWHSKFLSERKAEGGRGDAANAPKLLTTSLGLAPFWSHTPHTGKSICLFSRPQSHSWPLRTCADNHNHLTVWPLPC